MAKLLGGTRIYGTANVDTQLFVTGGVASTSNNTGTIQVTGGVGITGNLYSGNHVITGTGNGITFTDGTVQTTNAATYAYSQAAFGLANTLQGGLNTANANIVISQGVNNTQNANITIIQGVDVGQNAAITIIQGVDTTQNTNISAIQGVDLTQNASIAAAFTLANTLQGGLNTANASIVIGQGVNNTQNANITIIQGVDAAQNASITLLQNTDLTQNTRIQAAFDKANTGSGGSSSGYLANAVIFANTTGYLSNSSSLQFLTSNNALIVSGPTTISGNVGIGIAPTGFRLSIAGGTPSAVPLYLSSDATNAYVYTPNNLYIGSTGSNPLVFVANNTEKMRIDASGNVTPGVTNTQTLGAVGDVWSNVYATTFTGALTGSASSNVLKTGDTMTGELTIQSFAPIINFFETDQTLPAGRRRLVQDGNNFGLRRNTAVAGDFSTEVYDFNIDASGNFTGLGNITATGTVSGTNISIIQGVDLTQNAAITIIQGVDTTQNTTITAIQGVDLTQNASISAAYGLANTLQGGLNTANANIVIGQGVNNTQNASITIIQGVDLTQNASISAAYGLANTLQGGLNTANANIVIGQGVNNTQNAAITIIQGVDLTQNSSISAAFLKANTVQANLDGANASIVIQQGVNATQNAAITIIQGVDTTQNASITLLQNTDLTQNASISAAFGLANTLQGGLNTANASIVIQQGVNATQNAAITVIQGVDVGQNAAITIIQGVDTTQNAAIAIIQGVDLTQNVRIQAAFDKANTGGSSSGGSSSGYLPNAIIVANTTGYLSNTSSLAYYTSNSTFILSAASAPTSDMLQVTNAGAGITTAGISALQVHYTGGVGAIESSASRIDLEAGTTSGSTWNGFRVVTTTPAATGVTINGIKFDNITAGAGINNIFYAGTGYDNIMVYNGNTLISGTGIISNAAISGSYSNFVNITASGTITAFSDRSLKENLNQIPNALEKVQQLTGYTFNRIDSGERQTGLIAQDVQKVLPEAVMEGKHLSVAYGNLVGLLVEAIKELNAKVTSLEEKLK